jgi:MtN3 and saliva related transmembrane protein
MNVATSKRLSLLLVIPAKAGIQGRQGPAIAPCSCQGQAPDPRFRGGDGNSLSRREAFEVSLLDLVVAMGQSDRRTLVVLFLSLITLYGCQDLVPRDTQSLVFPGLQRSEIFGFVAGFGTTFAAVPDLISMLKRRSRAEMNPMMAAIMGTFQILWIYYGFLIVSRPVIAWNAIAVLINFLTVGAYGYFGYKEKLMRT